LLLYFRIARHPGPIRKLQTEFVNAWRPPCSRKPRENTHLPTRAADERARACTPDSQLACVPRGSGSCLCRTRTWYIDVKSSEHGRKNEHENSFLLKGSVHRQRKSAKIMLLSTLVSGDSRVHTSCVPGRADLVQASSGRCPSEQHLAIQASIAVSGRCRPSQVIEFVFAASPETTRSELQENPSLSRLAAAPRSLRRRGSLFFLSH